MTRVVLAPRLLAAAAFGLCAVAGAQPVPDPSPWTASVGVLQRRLVERADNGARLVTETGPLLRLQLQSELHLANGGSLQAQGVVASGSLDYAGQTQGGTALASTTGHRDLEAGVAWAPWAPARWGEAWITLDVLQQRRQIASTSAAVGLRETSTLDLPGLRWSGVIEAGGWQWRPSLAWRTSVHHGLRIAYGGLYDDSDLQGGRRSETVLALGLLRPGSPWQWELRWSHARQSASSWQSLTRGGVAVGNVRQPRIEIDDVGVQLRRAF